MYNSFLHRHLRLASPTAPRVTTTPHRRRQHRSQCHSQPHRWRRSRYQACSPSNAVPAAQPVALGVSHGPTTTGLRSMRLPCRPIRLPTFIRAPPCGPSSCFLPLVLHTRIHNTPFRDKNSAHRQTQFHETARKICDVGMI
jgi:hypothetical protein